LAQQARQTLLTASAARTSDDVQLALAYDHCEALTAEHSRSFYMASRLLPAQKRRYVRALYAFCRSTDDIVDYPDAIRRRRCRFGGSIHCTGAQARTI
jgi:15-cis-phytoene synthase